MLRMLVKMEVVVVVLEMEKMVKDNNSNEKGATKERARDTGVTLIKAPRNIQKTV